MEKRTYVITGGTVILGGRAADHLDKRDPYDGLLRSKRCPVARFMDLETSDSHFARLYRQAVQDVK